MNDDGKLVLYNLNNVHIGVPLWLCLRI